MQFICLVTASYTLGFFMTKSPGLVFRMKPKFSKQIFFGIFIANFPLVKNACHINSKNGKKAYHKFSWYGKTLIMFFSKFFFWSMK